MNWKASLRKIKIPSYVYLIFINIIFILLMIAYILSIRSDIPSSTPDHQYLNFVEFSPGTKNSYPRSSDVDNLPTTKIQLNKFNSALSKSPQHVYWYKAKFKVDSVKNNFSVYVPYVTNAAVIFVNKVEIGNTAKEWPPLQSSLYTPKFWSIPETLIHSGENEVLIAVYNYMDITSGIPVIQVGANTSLIPTYQRALFLQQYAITFSAATNFIILVLSLLIWLNKRKINIYIWLMLLTSVSFSFYGYLQENINQLMFENLGAINAFKLLIFSELLIGPFLYMTISNLYQYKNKRVELFILFTCIGLSITLIYSNKNLAFMQLICLLITEILTLTSSFIAQWRGFVKSSNKLGRFFALGNVFLGPFIIYDFAIGLHLIQNYVFLLSFGTIFRNLFIITIISDKLINELLIARTNEYILVREIKILNKKIKTNKEKKHQHELQKTKNTLRLQLWEKINHDVNIHLTNAKTKQIDGTWSLETAKNALKKFQTNLSKSLHSHLNIEHELALVLMQEKTKFTEQLLAVGKVTTWHVHTPLQIGVDIKHNLILILESAVEIIKNHSTAHQVHFSFEENQQALKVHISDSGVKAYSTEHSSQLLHLNLQDLNEKLVGMKNRVQLLGGKWTDSLFDKGIVIGFQIPLSHSTQSTDTFAIR